MDEDRFVQHGDLTVLDRKTGLMWQRGASADPMVWKDGLSYIDRLNEMEYGGFNDWRFPSKEELAGLIASEEDRRTGLFIHPLFGHQRNCWTSTTGEHHRVCYVDFYYGETYLIEGNYANHCVRAVRTHRE